MSDTGSGGGTVLNDAQIIALWIKAGGPISTAPAALAHALAESSGRAEVTSANPDGGTNVGIWQIDTKGVGAGYSVSQLQNSLTNAKLAVKGSNGGRDWAQWPDQWQNYAARAQQAVQKFKGDALNKSNGSWFSWADVILKGLDTAGHDVSHGIGSLLSLPSQVLDFFTALERPVQGLMWFVDPANWARMIAGVVGFVFLAAGLITLGLAA